MPSRSAVSRFYHGTNATALGKALSRFWTTWASFGLPPYRQVGLELRGRRSGHPHVIAMVIVTHAGTEYLVSMLGECEWVRNARAQREAWIVNRRRRKVRLEEVPVDLRAPIVKEYLRLAPGARPHIGLGKHATLAACEGVAPRHPVFRIVNAGDGHRDRERPMTQRVETLTPPNTPTPIGPYNHIAKVGEHIWIGGTAGVDPATGQLAPR
jgi:hypothetical protein